MLVHIREIVKKAEKGGYAIGAFNVHNFETIKGVLSASAKAKSPAIVQVSEGAIAYMGLETFVAMMQEMTATIAPCIPIALNIDHGASFESVVACAKAGFTSIHIDGSHLPLQENIRITAKVIKAVRNKGVWVQGEVGPIMGGHGNVGGRIKDVPLADPEEVIEFIRSADVDTLAAAIGTAHGAYTNEKINFELLKRIKGATKKTFVLHGGSGNDDKEIKKAIKMGVNIVNIGTDIKVAFSRALIDNCIKNKKETDPRVLLRPTMTAVEDVVITKMKAFGSAGRCR